MKSSKFKLLREERRDVCGWDRGMEPRDLISLFWVETPKVQPWKICAICRLNNLVKKGVQCLIFFWSLCREQPWPITSFNSVNCNSTWASCYSPYSNSTTAYCWLEKSSTSSQHSFWYSICEVLLWWMVCFLELTPIHGIIYWHFHYIVLWGIDACKSVKWLRVVLAQVKQVRHIG